MTVTSLAAHSASQGQIVDAIASASRSSGVGFNYLLATAKRESALNNTAKSNSSSASGLYQFVAQTWLSTLKAHGHEYGLGAYADAISRDATGRLSVADPALKGEILALRQDPLIASQMAAALAGDNAKSLESKLNRPPSEGELYAAHMLGAAGAARLIDATSLNPQMAADAVFPEAAAANRGLFYAHATGAPVTLAALHARLTGGEAAAPAIAANPSGASVFSGFSMYEPAAAARHVPVSFGSNVLAILNAIQPGDGRAALPADDKEKDKDKARAKDLPRPVSSI